MTVVAALDLKDTVGKGSPAFLLFSLSLSSHSLSLSLPASFCPGVFVSTFPFYKSEEKRSSGGQSGGMQRRRSTPTALITFWWTLMCAIGAIAVAALVVVHVVLLPSATAPDSYKLPQASSSLSPPPFPFPLFLVFCTGRFSSTVLFYSLLKPQDVKFFVVSLDDFASVRIIESRMKKKINFGAWICCVLQMLAHIVWCSSILWDLFCCLATWDRVPAKHERAQVDAGDRTAPTSQASHFCTKGDSALFLKCQLTARLLLSFCGRAFLMVSCFPFAFEVPIRTEKFSIVVAFIFFLSHPLHTLHSAGGQLEWRFSVRQAVEVTFQS